jgi:excisionase family DNA binding protein
MSTTGINTTSPPILAMLDFEPLLNVKEAAGLLRLHARTVQEWAKSGVLPAIRLGKYWMFRKTALDSWLRDRLQTPLPTRSR